VGERGSLRPNMRFCFVSTNRGSHFMTELLSAISMATAAAGHSVELAFDEFPPLRDECVYVVVPHEFDAWGSASGLPDAQQRARTIALCTENPGTPWFEETFRLAPRFGAAASLNRSSAAELRRRGVDCEHLQLGYSPLWDSWLRDEGVHRDLDLLYLGAADPRRDPLLASFGGDLWARRCQFLVPPLEVRTAPRPDFLTGTQKYHRLRASQVLLNLHRTTSSALEWMRFLEAICNGCVVVSEPCLDGDPLVAGEHYVATRVEDIGTAVDRLLDDPERLKLMRERAYDFVRQELTMEPAGRRLAELAAELPRQPQGARGLPPRSAAEGSPPPPAPSSVEAQPVPPPAETLPLGPNRSGSPLASRGPRRILRQLSTRLLGVQDGVQILAQTPAYAEAEPRVSVLTVIADEREREASTALIGVGASSCDRLELLILRQAGGDRPVPALSRFLGEHPSLPAALLQQQSDLLGRSLNTLVARARGEYVFILDATGGIYPSTLQRLARALDADPESIFSYPMVALFDGDRPVDLLSSLPWEPQRLKSGNWIDATALVRRSRLVELGCYSTDPRLSGWEHFDLWCRCAVAGGHGAHVAQVLAWRRRTADLAASDTAVKWALMRERFPQLLALEDEG
jgi:hypothetical protein